ncbi:MAG: DUF4167 domain-containing protein [Holosporales bacterium]|jgi:hypothetical protein|nr:DUF4167 domain-containing protein [Holosporales bacterium]
MKKELNLKGRAYYQNLRTKFLLAAKDASLSGDRILSEYNLQIAEHYSRIISEKFSNFRDQRKVRDHVAQYSSEKIDKIEDKKVQEIPVDPPPVNETPETVIKLSKNRKFRAKSTEKINESVAPADRESVVPTNQEASDNTVVKRRRVPKKIKDELNA